MKAVAASPVVRESNPLAIVRRNRGLREGQCKEQSYHFLQETDLFLVAPEPSVYK
jgi:hypothetical protein